MQLRLPPVWLEKSVSGTFGLEIRLKNCRHIKERCLYVTCMIKRQCLRRKYCIPDLSYLSNKILMQRRRAPGDQSVEPHQD